MPLHLLGKKSWNVYNSTNIARVKRDEEAAAARETAEELRLQELDAERRAAILRGRTPPPLPDLAVDEDSTRARAKDDSSRHRKRRKLAGEDDTDMDIRLARSHDDNTTAKTLKLRNEASDAPLMDTAGHIDLFPVDLKAATMGEKRGEAESEKKRKHEALEDQYTMRFSNAAGKGGLDQPWYFAQRRLQARHDHTDEALKLSAMEGKDVWGNEDPLRKEREMARLTSNDPLAIMQRAQVQLKRSAEAKRKWAAERKHELQELQAYQESKDNRDRPIGKHKRDDQTHDSSRRRRGEEKSRSSGHEHGHRNRSRSSKVSESQVLHRSEHRSHHGNSKKTGR